MSISDDRTKEELKREVEALRQRVQGMERAHADELDRTNRRFETLINSLDGIVWEATPDFQFTFVSQQAERLLGYPVAEWLTKDFWARHVYARDVDTALRYCISEVAAGRNHQFEYRMVAADGSAVWLRDIVNLVYEKGELVALRGIMIDISAYKQAQASLRLSEQQYRHLIESIPDGISVLDREWRYVIVNELAAQNIPMDKEKVIGKRLQEIFPGIEKSPFFAAFERVMEDRQPETLTQNYRFPDGREQWYNVRIYPVPQGIMTIATNITQQHQSESARRESEAKFRAVFEHAALGIILTDAKRHFVAVNPAFERIIGYSENELLGQPLDMILHPDDDAEREKALFGEMRAGHRDFFQIERRYICKKGNVIWARVSVSVLRDPEGELNLVIGLIEDITEYRQMVGRLQNYADELEKSNKEVRSFAYILSHDLRAPLLTIKGFASELAGSMNALAPHLQAMIGHVEENERPLVENAVLHDIPEALTFIDSATLQMKNLLDAILKLSRLGRSPLCPEPIDMNVLVGQVLKGMAYNIEKGEVEIEVGALPDVIADRTAMEHIMRNALSNAVLYLDPARRGRITVTGETGEKETFFHISDNGRGILKENIQKIWTPFRRGSHTDIEGEGMGLVYMQTLVSRHNGSIHLESVYEEGTTLTFSIARTGEAE